MVATNSKPVVKELITFESGHEYLNILSEDNHTYVLAKSDNGMCVYLMLLHSLYFDGYNTKYVVTSANPLRVFKFSITKGHLSQHSQNPSKCVTKKSYTLQQNVHRCLNKRANVFSNQKRLVCFDTKNAQRT